MADLIQKRLQVFVSSTYEDLKEERQAVIEAILTAGHIPAGMELFTAGDESQMQVIQDWIDQSDVYMLLLGGRYGSIEPNSGKSYTHLEYDYAVEKGKPLFALVITDDASEARVREHGSSVIERTNPSQYIEFKKLVLSNMSAFWEDKKDIKIKTGESLNNISRRDGLIGWVRSDKTINPEVTNEIARLSKENSELRKNAGGATFNGLTFEEMKTLLEKENTLEALVKNRLGLLSEKMSQNRLSDSAIRKLLERDLIARAQDHNRNDILRLTDVGRMFLNKLDIEN